MATCAIKLICVILGVIGVVSGCRNATVDPIIPVDQRLARVIRYNSRLSDYASEDQYVYNAKGQLSRIIMNSWNRKTDQRTLGHYDTYTYSSTDQLVVKTSHSQFSVYPWYATQELHYTYPTTSKIVETTYSVFPANSPGGAGPPYRTSYSETLLENGLPNEHAYFTRDSLPNGTNVYTYQNGKLQREAFLRNGVPQYWTQYTYQGNTVTVESFNSGFQGVFTQRRQTLDASGRVIRDEVLFEASFGESGMSPDVYLYEYVN